MFILQLHLMLVEIEINFHILDAMVSIVSPKGFLNWSV